MGNCLPPVDSKGRKKTGRRRESSSLANLNDSRHVMMKRSSMKGAQIQKDGSFYRPRDDKALVDIQRLSEVTRDETNDTKGPSFADTSAETTKISEEDKNQVVRD